jgi:hypothetical protein
MQNRLILLNQPARSLHRLQWSYHRKNQSKGKLWEQNITNPVAHGPDMFPISSLFRSFINTPDGRLGPQSDLIWTLAHDPSRSKTVSDTIADFLDQKSPDGGFTRLSDVFCIAMHKADRKHGQSGGEVLVELEETMFMGELRA